MLNRIPRYIAVLLFAVTIALPINGAVDYARSMAHAMQAMQVRPDQQAGFDKIVRRYFRRRNSAADRVLMRQRGAFDTMLKREVGILRRKAEKNMTKVLDPEQMEHFARFLNRSEAQYLRMYRIAD